MRCTDVQILNAQMFVTKIIRHFITNKPTCVNRSAYLFSSVDWNLYIYLS